MQRLEEMRIENAALHDKISILKQQRGGGLFEGVDKNYTAEIELTKAKVLDAEQQTAALKKELSNLIKKQEEMQRKIESEKSLLNTSLLPILKHEETVTQAFYERLLTKFGEIPDIEISLLKELVSTVQKKRKAVADETEESQRIARLIKFNKAQTKTDEQTTPRAENITDRKPSDVFDDPLPCVGLSVAKRRGRRRVTFQPRKADSVAVLD